MLKILLVETSPINKNSDVTVHVRNSIILNEYLKKNNDCRLVCDDSGIPDVEEQYDFIIFISATFYFKHERFLELMKNQKNCKIGWITNEFELFQQNFLKQYGTDFIISNFEEFGIKKAHKYTKFLMTNLNALQARPNNFKHPKDYEVCYYGTYRKYREVYFRKYLQKEMILSTSGKNIKKFQLSGCDCWLTDKFSWIDQAETLNKFKSSLYIEDTVTHKLFNHMANRFYEGLYCNCATFFDKSCLNTIKRDIYDIPDYFIVDGYDELMDKSKNVDEKLVDYINECNIMKALQAKEKCFKDIEEFLKNY